MRPAAYAVLNFDALKHNLARVRECTPNARVMAVIKANAYGHGLQRIAENLHDADAFAVARVDEGVWLRQRGFKQRIAVLEGFTCEEELRMLIQFRLEAVIHSPEQLVIVKGVQEREQLTVWLKLDTGMNRLGFRTTEFNEAYRFLQQSEMISKPLGLMTHLANADNREDLKTVEQLKRFRQVVDTMEGECSIANSAGILGWQESVAEWVRPGIMLYGVSPFPDREGWEMGLKPVMSLYSRLIAVKRIEKGETVGYGGAWVCPETTTLGVVAIGYGDGYPRQVESGTPVLVKGQRVPLVGRVSMDMITVDLQGVKNAMPGDPVTLWGAGLPVEEIARCAGTIPYTLLCGITRRVQLVVE